LFALGSLLAAVVVLWLLFFRHQPPPPQLAQETTRINQLVQDRLGDRQNHISIDMSPDGSKAWVRASDDQTCTTLDFMKVDSEWRFYGERRWSVPCPLQQNDVAALVRFVRVDVTLSILPFSWQQVSRLPQAVARRLSYGILSVDGSTNGP